MIEGYYTSRMSRRYGAHATVANIRRVWAAITRAPAATVRELETQLGMPHSAISATLRLLRDAGYIAFDDRAAHGRTIVIPFYEER